MHIVAELNNHGNVQNLFIRGIGLIRSEHHGWYLHNARTDVIQRVNDDGEILHTYRYNAFGTELAPCEDNTNPFRFCAEYYDFETGRTYLRHRSYDPTTGRFTQEDPHWGIHNMAESPIARLQAGNLYMYCAHNPVRWTDPTGLHIYDNCIGIDTGGGTVSQQAIDNLNRAVYLRDNPPPESSNGFWGAVRRIGGAVVDGFVGVFTAPVHAISHAINNPAETFISIVTTIVCPQTRAMIILEQAASKKPLYRVLMIINAYRTDGLEGVAYLYGQHLAIGAIIVCTKGAAKGAYKLSKIFKNSGIFMKSNAGNLYDITPAQHHSSITTRGGGPTTGRANSSLDIFDNQGRLKTRRWFDSDGRAIRDIHFWDHGNSAMHPEVPHQQFWDWSNPDAPKLFKPR